MTGCILVITIARRGAPGVLAKTPTEPLVVGFASFGMGEVWLARNPTSNVYAMYIAIALAGIANSKRQLNYENYCVAYQRFERPG